MDFLEMITYMTINDLEDNKMTFKKINMLHNSLDENEPVTYLILANDPKATDDEKKHYMECYNKLRNYELKKNLMTIEKMGFEERTV